MTLMLEMTMSAHDAWHVVSDYVRVSTFGHCQCLTSARLRTLVCRSLGPTVAVLIVIFRRLHYFLSIPNDKQTLINNHLNCQFPGYWLLVKVFCRTRHKTGHFGDVPQANLGWFEKKQNLTEQKRTFTNQKKCTITQNKHKKTKARFSRLLQHPAWKRRGPVLVLALCKFVTYLLRHLPTGPDPRFQVCEHGSSVGSSLEKPFGNLWTGIFFAADQVPVSIQCKQILVWFLVLESARERQTDGISVVFWAVKTHTWTA